jgi:hypothetical protein
VHISLRAKLPLCLAVGLILAGCGHAAAPQVATARSAAPPHAATPTRSAAAEPTDYDKALRYTRCMTANGAPTADPVAGKALVTINVIHVGESAATLKARSAAFGKCKQYLPTTWPLRVDPADVARSRAFVACVRGRGLSWPEPDANGMAAWPTDPQAMSTPAYDAAIRACRHLYDDPANQLPENR